MTTNNLPTQIKMSTVKRLATILTKEPDIFILKYFPSTNTVMYKMHKSFVWLRAKFTER